MSSQATAGEAAPELRVRSLRWFFGVGERDGLPEAAGWSARPWCRRRTARRAGEGLGCGARLEVVMATDVDMREHVQMRSMTGQVGFGMCTSGRSVGSAAAVESYLGEGS
jgi:hypothetical protein